MALAFIGFSDTLWGLEAIKCKKGSKKFRNIPSMGISKQNAKEHRDWYDSSAS